MMVDAVLKYRICMEREGGVIKIVVRVWCILSWVITVELAQVSCMMFSERIKIFGHLLLYFIE